MMNILFWLISAVWNFTPFGPV